MKKVFLCLLTISSLWGCQKSLEDKAQDAIKLDLRKSLYHFDSYEPLETIVDSAFNTYANDPFLRQYIEVLNEHVSSMQKLSIDLEVAESSVAIWGDLKQYSGTHGSYEYNIALQDKRQAEADLRELFKKIAKSSIEYYNHEEQNPESFIGWTVKHTYKAKTKAGDPEIGRSVYVFSPDFKTILLRMEEPQYIGMNKALQILETALPKREIFERSLATPDSDTTWRAFYTRMKSKFAK